MIVLGVDPGYDRLGLAILENKNSKENLIYSECFKTNAQLPFPERLSLVAKKFETTIKDYKPQMVALEEIFINKNQKTASKISEIRGVLIYLTNKNNIQILEYSPPEIKLATTGYGRADKLQVGQMVSKILNIEKAIKYDDELDAIAVGLTCLAKIKPSF